MMQPNVANNFLSNDILDDQGLLSRFLIAYPNSIAGSRIYDSTDVYKSSEFISYKDHTMNILKKELPLLIDKNGYKINELDLPDITLDPDAKDLWIEFYNDVEKQIGKGGNFEAIRSFGNKTGEHCLRIAGVLSLFQNINRTTIDKQTLENAIRLSKYYLNEAIRLTKIPEQDQKMEIAQKVLEWLKNWTQKQGSKIIALPDIYQNVPYSKVRQANKARDIMKILTQHGYTQKHEGKVTTIKGKKSNESWELLV